MTLDELNVFIGIIIFSSFNRRLSQRDYWSNDPLLHSVPVASAMSCNNFEMIKSKLKFSKPEDNEPANKVWRVQKIVDFFRKKIDFRFVFRILENPMDNFLRQITVFSFFLPPSWIRHFEFGRYNLKCCTGVTNEWLHTFNTIFNDSLQKSRENRFSPFFQCYAKSYTFPAAILRILIKIDFFKVQNFKVHVKIAWLLLKTGRFNWYSDLKKLLFPKSYPKIFQNFHLNWKIFWENQFFILWKWQNLKEHPWK